MIQNHPIIRTSAIFANLTLNLANCYVSAEIDILKKKWSDNILEHLKVNLKVIGAPAHKGPLLILGNHISYLDIPVLLSLVPHISFLSKSEVKYWPLIGALAYKLDTVFVKRGCSKSRQVSRESISKALLSEQKVIAGFPSGTTSLSEAKPWRHGLFEVAYSSKVPVQPFRIKYEPLRPVAYIDEDQFLNHLYKLVQLKEINVTIEFNEPIMIKNPSDCSAYWHKWAQEFLQ